MGRYDGDVFGDVVEKLTMKKPEIVQKSVVPNSGLLAGIPLEMAPGRRVYVTVRHGTIAGGGIYDSAGMTTTAHSTPASPGYFTPETNLTDVQAFHQMSLDFFDGLQTPSALWNAANMVLVEMRDQMQHRLRTMYTLPHKGGTTLVGDLAEHTGVAGNVVIGDPDNRITVELEADPTADPPTYGAWYLRVNGAYDLYAAATLLTNSPAQIISIDRDRKTVTLGRTSGTDITMVAGTTYKLYAEKTAAPLVTEAKGGSPIPFAFIADDAGTLHGVNRATAGNEWWKGVVVDAAGGSELTQDNIEALLNKVFGVSLEFKEPDAKVMFATRKGLQNLRDDLIANHNIDLERVPPNSTMKFGPWAYQIDDTTINYDPYVPPGQCYMPDLDSLVRYQLRPIGFSKVGGQTVYQHPDNTEMRRVSMIHPTQLVCKYAASQGKIIRMSGDHDFNA